MTVESYNYVVFRAVADGMVEMHTGTMVLPTYIDVREKLLNRFPGATFSVCNNGFLKKDTLRHLPTGLVNISLT